MFIDWDKVTKKPIASGSVRQVYGYGKDFAIKVPKKSKYELGQEQNEVEASIYETEKIFKPFLAKVFDLDYSSGECILVVERLKPLEKDLIRLDEFLKMKGLRVSFSYQDIVNFADRHDLHLSDIMYAHQWGISKEGVIKLLDYGATSDYYYRTY